MVKPARIAVVGAGSWGRNLVRVAAELGVLAAVCDTDARNLAAVRSISGDVPLTANFDDLLDPRGMIDALVLAVPAHLHARYALAAIAAGKDVFVEKPLSLSASDADAIVAAAAAAGRKVFVGHLLFYHGAVRALLACVQRGDIGDVVHVRSRRLSWGRLREFENVWWSFAPHDVAIMLALFENDEPAAVQAATTAHIRPDIADFAYADFRFSRGGTAHIEVSWIDVDKSTRLDVFGTTGVVTFTDSREHATLRLTPAGAVVESGTPVLRKSPARDIPFPTDEPLKVELAAFVDWIRLGIAPPTDGIEGRRVVGVLEMTQRAADAAARSRAVTA